MNKGLRGFILGTTIISTLMSPLSGMNVRAGIDIPVRSEKDIPLRSEKTESGDSEKTVSIRPQDDFYGYVNADALRNAEIDPKYGVGSFNLCGMTADLQKAASIDRVLNGEAADSEDAQIISTYYKQLTSYQADKSTADADFIKVMEEIQGVDTMSELIELSGKYKHYYDVCPFLKISVADGYKKWNEYGFEFDGFDYVLGVYRKDIAKTEEGQRSLRTKVKNILTVLGEDKNDANKKADGLTAMIVDICYECRDEVFRLDSLKYLTDEEINEAGLDTGSLYKGLELENPNGEWLICLNKEFQSVAEKLSDESNLQSFKTWLLVDYIENYYQFLSDDYKELKQLFGPVTQSADELAKIRISTDLPDQLGHVYAQFYYPEERDKKVREMCEEIRSSYRTLISNADWLSADGKQKLLKKLENIEFKTGGSYSEYCLDAKQALGNDAYQSFKNIRKFKWDNTREIVKHERPKRGAVMQPQVANACFWLDNVVVITGAITEKPFFDPDRDKYANLGALGMVIAHEVGHAFDSNCIKWDDEGNYNPEWLNEADRKALAERADMCIDYYNEYTVMDVYHVDGVMTLGENYADLGALECITNIAKTDDDARTMYESYGMIWRNLCSDRMGIVQLHQDEHSPGIVRVNAPLSSCERFYEVYDIKEGDGMYVAPEKRVKRW